MNIFRLGQDFPVTRLLQEPVAWNIFVKSVYYWSGFKLNLAYFIMMYLMVMSSINSKVKILRSISCKLSGFRCNPWYESGAKFIFWAIWKWIKLYFKHMMWEKCIGWNGKISGKGSQTSFYSFLLIASIRIHSFQKVFLSYYRAPRNQEMSYCKRHIKIAQIAWSTLV